MNSQIPPNLAMLLPDSFVNLSPEQALLLAVLDRAVRDIIDFNKSKRCADNAAKRGAWTWLKSNDNDTCFSFVRVCEELNMDLNHIRKQIIGRIDTPAFIACFEEASGHTKSAISSLPRRGRLRAVQRNKMRRLERDREDLSQLSVASDLETSDLPPCVSNLCAAGKSR